MWSENIFEKKDEAIIRLELLVKQVNLPSILLDMYKKNEQPIMLDPMQFTIKNSKIKEQFDKFYIRLIEEQSVFPYFGFILNEDTIFYLFVSNHKNDWENERIKEDNLQYI